MPNEVTTAKILIVDDEPTNVRLLERLLQATGYRNLESTTDSRRVLELYQVFGPDLILLDLLMPHLDGIACARAAQGRDSRGRVSAGSHPHGRRDNRGQASCARCRRQGLRDEAVRPARDPSSHREPSPRLASFTWRSKRRSGRWKRPSGTGRPGSSRARRSRRWGAFSPASPTSSTIRSRSSWEAPSCCACSRTTRTPWPVASRASARPRSGVSASSGISFPSRASARRSEPTCG